MPNIPSLEMQNPSAIPAFLALSPQKSPTRFREDPERNNALPFPRRLIAALRAGEAAGGDKRGKQSAALVICGDEEWPDLNLRVDDHTDPLGELERLESVSREYFVHVCRFLPNRRDRVGVTDLALIDREAKALAAQDSS
jgi:uncharacterized Ntn-hydrolase superfamily protein